jgi:hypothetical protein
MKFQSITLPTGKTATIPANLKLEFYSQATLSAQQRQATAYIPWNEAYLQHIPAAYRDFFQQVLPHLSKRTTNVHTALSAGQLPWLLHYSRQDIDSHLVHIAVILHDVGWGKVSLAGIADSLSYNGLLLSPTSRIPKEQHILIGVALAWDILDAYTFDGRPLSEADKRHVASIIRQHDYDAPWERGCYPQLSPEAAIVCDADRLWSYTHENFWQDTVRKNVLPESYIVNLTKAVDNYFLTPQAKARAHQLLAQRQQEVASYLQQCTLAFAR